MNMVEHLNAVGEAFKKLAENEWYKKAGEFKMKGDQAGYDECMRQLEETPEWKEWKKADDAHKAYSQTRRQE